MLLASAAIMLAAALPGPARAQSSGDASQTRNQTQATAAADAAATDVAPQTTAAQEKPDTGGLELEPITISANLTDTPSTEVGSAVTVITGEQMQRQQIRFVQDALRQVPGVSVNETGPAGQMTEVRIRGSEANQTLVVIDGIVVNDPAMGSQFDFSSLLATDIARVEVLRGPQSALYGSDAVGGVINIVTRKGKGTDLSKPEIVVRGEGGTYGTADGSLTVSGANDRVNYLLGLSGITSQNVSAAAAWRGNPEDDSFRNGTATAKIGADLSENFTLDVVARRTQALTDLDTFEGGVGAVDLVGSDVRLNQTFGRAQGTLSLLDGHWQQIFGTSYTDQSNDYFQDDVYTSSYVGTMQRYDYQSNVNFDTDALADASHVLTFGALREIDEANGDTGYSTFDHSIWNNTFTGQYQLGVLEKLFLTGSVQFNENELFDNSTTYRATAAYLFDQTGTKIRSSIGSGVKNPTLFELYGYTNTYQGNADLQPEKATGWDFGVDQQLWDGRVVLGATYFVQLISDLITGTGTTSVNVPGTSRIQGVELSANAQVTTDLTLAATYTYTDGYDAEGNPLVRRPRNMASLVANYKFLEGKANVNASVAFNGAQWDYGYTSTWDTYYTNLDSYTLINLAGSYDINDHAQVFARVTNLLDEKYEQVWSYGSPGRAGYAGMKFRF
ncbi:TonB-dependent receptor [Pseudoxanthobacter sp.]|uniref:TonB-dependent receptor plug domain-containing protein n=1 Tax=Pseudoxanthobacter sp. TaxID=1925742 RepID=UPI002FE3FD0A